MPYLFSISASCFPGYSALIKASRNNHLEEVKALLWAKASPDIRDVKYGKGSRFFSDTSRYDFSRIVYGLPGKVYQSSQ